MSADSQVALKIKLERTYAPEIRRVFRRMLRDFRVAVGSTGQAPNAMKFRSLWESTTSNHVDRVQRAFRGEATRLKLFNVDGLKRTEDDEELLALALLRWRDEFAGEQADIITSTNEREQITALRLGRQSLQEDGEPVTNRGLALAAGAILARRYAGRVQTIAMSQTQPAAESTKFIETEVESGQVPRVIDPLSPRSRTTKTWKTVGDKVVRPSHVKAEGQTRPLNSPFIVDGEALLFPGDPSLGASAKNVINCRCVAIYHPA